MPYPPKLLEREFDATVAVPRPIDFAADADRALMAALRKSYEGRCWKGAFIRKILCVVRRSSVRIGQDSSAEGTVSVWFRARIAIYERWRILPQVRIAITTPMIGGEYFEADDDAKTDVKNADVIVRPTAAASALAPSALVPCRVANVVYRPGMLPIISAFLLTCELDAPVYYTRGVIDSAELPILRAMLEAVRDELQRRAALIATNPGPVWFFEALFYSYAGVSAAPPAAGGAGPGADRWSGPPELALPLAPFNSRVDLLALASAAAGEEAAVDDDDGASVAGSVAGRRVLAGYWTRPLHFYRSSPSAVRFPTNAAGVTATALGGTALLVTLLTSQLEWLQCIRELAERYPDNAAIAAQRSVWAALRSSQLPRPEA